MATTYTRRINLYINGKEVKNDIISIRREMTKLTNEQARMTVGSKQYQKHAAGIKSLKGVISEHNKALTATADKPSLFTRAADGFNRFQSVAVAAIALFTGIAMVMKSTIQAFADYDEALTDTIKVTRMTKDEGKELVQELSKIDTRTGVNELLNLSWVAGKLGISGKQNILEFTEAANQIGVALARDLGGAEAAIRELGKLTDIFQLKDLYGQSEALLKVGSAINELGMASTASEQYLINFAKRTAGIAPQANVGIEDILGLGATLDALGQRAEMSSTAYSKLMVTMTKRTAEFASVAKMSEVDFNALFATDANEAMVRVFEGMNENKEGFGKLVSILGDLEIEGQRMTSVFGALAKNTKMLRAQQDLSTKSVEQGISVTREYNLKNNTAQATLEKYRKRFVALQVQLGEKMMPIYGQVIKKASTLLKVLGATIEFLSKYGKELGFLIIVITAYSIATKIATAWTKKHGEATLYSLTLQKLQALAFHAQFAAIALYNTIIALAAGKTKIAAIQFRAFSAALSANPIGLVVGAIAAISAALYIYSSRLTEAQKLQLIFNNANLEAEKQIVEQRLEIEQLLRVAKNETRSKEDRIEAIKKLNEISPDYLGGLKLETINTEEATTATDKYIQSLRDKARIIAAQDKLVEIEKQLIEVRQGELSFTEKAQSAGLAYALGLRLQTTASEDLADMNAFRAKKEKELTNQAEKLTAAIEEQKLAMTTSPQITPDNPTNELLIKAKQKELAVAMKMPQVTEEEIKARKEKISVISDELKALRELAGGYEETIDLIKEQEDALEAARAVPATTIKEITTKNKKVETIERKIAELKELGTSKQGDSSAKNLKEAEKKKFEILEASFNEEQAFIRQGYLQGKMNEDEFNDQMLFSELKFLADKLKIYKVGSKEYQEAVNEAMELQVTVDNKLRDLQLKAEDELASAQIENFRDEFERLEEAEKERWFVEKQALEKRLIEKDTINAKEQAINDAIHALIEEKEATHQQKITDLKTGKNLAELENMVNASTPFDAEYAELDEMQKMFAAKNALIAAQYENEKTLAAGNKSALLVAEKNHNNSILQLKLDMIDAEWQQKEQRIAAGQSFITALSGMVDQETALGKALFLFNQGLAIAEIWMSVAKANAKAVTNSPMTAGMPWVAINTGIGVVQTGLVLAQTVKSFSSPGKDKGYSEGGPTPPGGKDEPAGIVHKGEYVVSKAMLADPQVKYITKIFEKMRTRRVSLSQAAMPLLSSGGFSSGNRNSMPALSITPSNSKQMEEQNKINIELTQAINELVKYRPTVAVETIEREREKYIRIKQTSGL